MEERPNPFNITKAVDLSDEEINKLWVDISEKRGFFSIVKPKSPMPMFILGGKGGGKTHVIRYFSFSLQKIRHSGKLLSGIQDEGYIGIYFRCSGLNAYRFLGKQQTVEIWQRVFAYYLELWLSQHILQIIEDIKKDDSTFFINEDSLVNSIVGLFDKYPFEKIPTSFVSLIHSFADIRKEIDNIVNNSGWTGKLEGLNIAASPGNLVFGIPSILRQDVRKLSNLQFVYLVDEFENLDVAHQEYINTLIRDRRAPSSIKVGVKLYGVRTYKTLGGGEENKEGSEFEKVVIDDYFRTVRKKYEVFSIRLCGKRLLEGGFPINKPLKDYFEEFDLSEFNKQYIARFERRTRPHFERLRGKLVKNGCQNPENIIDLLSVPNDPLIERTNIFLFYRKWNKYKSIKGLKNAAVMISEETSKLMQDRKRKGEHQKVLDKYKADILAQFMLENGERILYTGLSTFINMSEGIPRNLLMIFKYIFLWSSFNGEFPFDKEKISLEAQYRGVQDAAEWFFDDARLSGNDGKKIRDSISRLAQLLREIRFSDVPPECSISAFSVNLSELTEETTRMITISTQCSYLIKAGERRDKNSRRIDTIYQINGILAPKWDLPIYKRGEIGLSKIELEAVFNPRTEDQFKKILKSRLIKYNTPFKLKTLPQTKGLFEE